MSSGADVAPVVVGVDGSPESQVAVDWAAREATMRRLPLKLVYVINPPMVMVFPEVPMPAGYQEWQQGEARTIVDAAAATATAAAGGPGRLEVSTEILTGPSVPALVGQSRSASMIVVGCRGRGALARGLLGSVSNGLVQHAACPVAVIHDEDPQVRRPSAASVVVGVDGSPASEKAVAIAFAEASLRGVDLLAVHAWSDSVVFEFPGTDWSTLQAMGEETLAQRLAGWQERYPDVMVRRLVVADRPAHQLIEQGQRAQLVVVGSHGRGGFAGMLLGSVSTAVVNASRVPVIVAR